MLRTAEAEPVASEVSYDLPTPATSTEELTAAALLLEQRCSAVYADMVGSTSGANRQWALEALEDAAVRSLSFGAEPDAFPGIAEL